MKYLKFGAMPGFEPTSSDHKDYALANCSTDLILNTS